MPRSYRHLDLSERVVIETQLRLGRRPAEIAACLKRARSTVSREMRRNGWRAQLRKSAIAGGYRCLVADRRARVLAGRARRQRKLVAGNQLWITMLEHLFFSLRALCRSRAHWLVSEIRSVFPMRLSTPHCMPCREGSSAPACWTCCAADTRPADRPAVKTAGVDPFLT